VIAITLIAITTNGCFQLPPWIRRLFAPPVQGWVAEVSDSRGSPAGADPLHLAVQAVDGALSEWDARES